MHKNCTPNPRVSIDLQLTTPNLIFFFFYILYWAVKKYKLIHINDYDFILFISFFAFIYSTCFTGLLNSSWLVLIAYGAGTPLFSNTEYTYFSLIIYQAHSFLLNSGGNIYWYKFWVIYGTGDTLSGPLFIILQLRICKIAWIKRGWIGL